MARRILKFYGASDDLFEIEGTGGDEPDERNPGTIQITTPSGEGLRVYCQYSIADNACWMVGVAPIDEDIPIPNWPCMFSLSERGYSAMLTMAVPVDAVVTNVSECDYEPW